MSLLDTDTFPLHQLGNERVTARIQAARELPAITMIAPLLDLAAESAGNGRPTPPAAAPFDDWKKQFDDWMAAVQARTHRYPPGFVLADSWESSSEGCGAGSVHLGM